MSKRPPPPKRRPEAPANTSPNSHVVPPQTSPPKLPPLSVPTGCGESPTRSHPHLPPPPTSTPRRNASPLGGGRRPQVPSFRADGSPRRNMEETEGQPRSTSRPPPPKLRPQVPGTSSSSPIISPPQQPTSKSILPPSSRPVAERDSSPRGASRPPPPKRRPSNGPEDKPKTIRKISESTGVSISEIRAANPELEGLDDDSIIPKGTRLRIPTSSSRSLPTSDIAPTRNLRPTSSNSTGETLAVLARRAGVPLTVIQTLNPHLSHVDPYLEVLPVGTTLHIPATDGVLDSTPAVEDVVAGTPRSEMSQTAPGNESILDIARSTNTSVQDILNLNRFLQDYPLDKPLPPKTRIQLPESDESDVESQTSTPSASPGLDVPVASLTTLREMSAFYSVPLHVLSGSNIQAAAVFGVNNPIPIGTKVTIPPIDGARHPLGVVHVTGEGPTGQPSRAPNIVVSQPVVVGVPPEVDGSSSNPIRQINEDQNIPESPHPVPKTPSTLESIAEFTGKPIDVVRGWGDLDDHIEVGVSNPPQSNVASVGQPENLWSVPVDVRLPQSVVEKLLGVAQIDSGKHRESLDSLAKTTKVCVENIRQANDELPEGYPSSKPVPRGMRIFIPKPPVATPILSPPLPSPPISSPTPAVVVDSHAASSSDEEPESPMLPKLPTMESKPIVSPSQQGRAGGGIFDRYIATGGETLADIANSHGVPVDELIQMNGALIDDPDEAFTDPLPMGVTVRVPLGSKAVISSPTASKAVDGSRMSMESEPPLPNVASPFLLRKQLQSQPETPQPRSERIEEPRATPALQPVADELIQRGHRDTSPNRGRHTDGVTSSTPAVPEATAAREDDGCQAVPTKTTLASGNESVRNVCDAHFLTEAQLRSMNPFLERYHSGTIIPRNTLIVLETAGFVDDGLTASQQQTSVGKYIEDVEGRKVFIVRSPTRERPRATSPHRAISAPDVMGTPVAPINTLKGISDTIGISEQVLRRRNPHLALVGLNDDLPRGTIVELEGSSMGPPVGQSSPPKQTHTTTSNSMMSVSNSIALSISKRNLNRRQVVRVMGHKTAVQVGQRYFSKWRLFVSLFNSKKLSHDILVENEMEKLRVQVQAGKITEADLRRRVTELRMAVDSTRPLSDEVALLGGIVTSPVRRASPLRGHIRSESIAVAAAYEGNYYRQAVEGLNTTGSPSRLTSTPHRVQPVMMASSPAAAENRAPIDRSREIGGIGNAVKVDSPLRDQSSIFSQLTPRRNLSPYRQLMATAQSVRSPQHEQSSDSQGQRRSLGMLLNGLRVVRVSGAASSAGVQANDLILRVDGSLVSSGTTFKSLVDRAKGPKVSVTLQTPTGHIFTVMLPLFGDNTRTSLGRGAELSRLAEPPLMRQASPRNVLLSSPYRRPVSASRR